MLPLILKSNSESVVYNAAQGFEWDSVADTYVRTGSLADIATSISAGNENLPIHAQMKRCLLNDDGTVNYYLDANNSALKADGITASDLTGADGQVMVQIPKFYTKRTFSGDNRKWEISLYPLTGFTVHSAFVKDGSEVDYRYIGAFEGSMYDDSAGAMVGSSDIATGMYASGDKLCSVYGYYPKTNETRVEFRSMAAERGVGWRQQDYCLTSAIQLLYAVEYADFNSQSMIGSGRTNLSGGDWIADEYIAKTGLSISNGNGTNSVSNGSTLGYLTDYMTYRGIENFFGHIYKFLDGIAWDGRWTGSAAAQPVYVSNNVDYFNDESGTNMTHLCDADYIGSASGYIGDIKDVTGFIPSAGGSSTTKLCDYYWQYSESGRNYWRVPRVGGAANGGSAAGAFALTVNDRWAHDVANVGARLCY